MYVTMRGPSQKLLNWGAVLLLASVFLLHYVYRTTPTSSTYWTPYQKLEVNPAGESQYQINVNNVGYMSIANVSSDYLRAHPDVASNLNRSSYDAPFRFIEARDRVLIVGGGAGNDADAALRNGAMRVDVVEIDPVIYSLGKRLHPDHPYDSPKVHVILDDARSYLRSCKEQYDVIVFGLVDSHTTISGYSNMRIDNYVYTEDSFREAKNLLKPTGVLVLKFEVRQPWTWMGERFHDMLTGLFGRKPLAFDAKQVGGLFSATVFLESKDPQFWSRIAQPDLASFVYENPPGFSLGPVPRPRPPTIGHTFTTAAARFHAPT